MIGLNSSRILKLTLNHQILRRFKVKASIKSWIKQIDQAVKKYFGLMAVMDCYGSNRL